MRRHILLPLIFAALLPLSAIADTNTTDANPSQMNVQNQNMNAIEIILQDHKQIKKMIAELEKNMGSETAKARATFQDLKKFLEDHETMEEKEWYPELEKHDELKDIVKKLKDQEEKANAELKDISDENDDKKWKTKVKQLIKDVKNHAQDEETKLFPKVKKVLDKSALEDLGKKMDDYRKQR